MIDYSGDITLTRSYTPFGEVLSESGTGESVYGYTGEVSDESGLVYLRARYYMPGSGRFLSRDSWQVNPIKPVTLNVWLYTDDNPIMHIDPTGHYGYDIHYIFTRSTVFNVAKNNPSVAVYATFLADMIAKWDQYVDEGSRLNSFVCLKCHFKSKSETIDVVNQAISTGDPAFFGSTMHLIQDYHSHWNEGYHTQWYGHAFDTTQSKLRNNTLLFEFYEGGFYDQNGYWHDLPFPKHYRESIISDVKNRNNQLNTSNLSDWDIIDLFLRSDISSIETLNQRMQEREFFGFDTDKNIPYSTRELEMERMSEDHIRSFLSRISSSTCGYGYLFSKLPPDNEKEELIHSYLSN
jgi:RHS repeat-associated protein